LIACWMLADDAAASTERQRLFSQQTDRRHCHVIMIFLRTSFLLAPAPASLQK